MILIESPDRQTKAEELPPILLPYQQDLLKATASSPLVVCEKSRRIGMSWTAAADAVLTASKKRRAGGMNVYYIGYNLEMARAFIADCAAWAETFQQSAEQLGGPLLQSKGKPMQSFRLRFASGFEIAALPARPRSLRGRQGFVIIDEAAFHDHLDALLKAALALMIWGGRLLVISTHEGKENPFNRLIKDLKEGKQKGQHLRVTFQEALEQGLYRRICLLSGQPWSQEAEESWRKQTYDFYGDAAEEELDVIPASGSGAYIPGSLLEVAEEANLPVLRWSQDQAFTLLPSERRQELTEDWMRNHLEGHLKALSRSGGFYLGADFGRKGHLTVFWLLERGEKAKLPTRLVVELRNFPFEQQRQILWALISGLPKLEGATLDAGGIGAQLSEETSERFGRDLVTPLSLTRRWYADELPGFKAAFEERRLSLPADPDIRADYRLIRLSERGPMLLKRDLPGQDGGRRHGDAAIAHAMAFYAARSRMAFADYAYRSLRSSDRQQRSNPFRLKGNW